MNKRKLRLIFCFSIVYLSASCNPPLTAEEAWKGLDADLAQLPIFDGFTVIKTLVAESSIDACNYAFGYVITETSLADTAAFDAYSQRLQSLGWVPGLPNEGTARYLTRGLNERVVVSSNEPSLDIQDAVGYAQLKQKYNSIIIIEVLYI